MAATKISVYSLTDLKTNLDDHLPLYLTSPNLPTSSTPLPRSLRFTQSNYRAAVRLGIGYAAVACALYIFYLDYYLKVPWREHKTITAWAVLAYGVLNIAMMAWSWFGGEAGLVFEGSRPAKGGVKKAEVRFYSLQPHQKYDPVYRMVVHYKVGAGVERRKEVTVPFTRFFQGDGTFVSGEFERWLRGEAPEVLSESGKVEMVQEVMYVDVPSKGSTPTPVVENGSSTAQDAVPASAKKRSKKRVG